MIRNSFLSETNNIYYFPEKLLPLPMYGSLPNAEQLKVFWRAAKDTRKVIVATNIAETSITIPNIVYGILYTLFSLNSNSAFQTR